MPRRDIGSEELMTRQEAADFMKVSLRTVDTLIHRKDFDAMVHTGANVRIFKPKLIKYLESNIWSITPTYG